jgi:hypothetical protein
MRIKFVVLAALLGCLTLLDEARMPESSAQAPSNGSGRSKSKGRRPGRLPKNLPEWFKELDADGDNQIALYEWKAKREDVQEFNKYDLNGDGFITVDEVVRSGHFTAANAPPSVGGLPGEAGDFYYFNVTGADNGVVWGTDVYTADSALTVAAVHAGVVEVDETKLVKVTILAGQRQYEGSERNGVTTQGFGPFARSFRIDEAP